MQTNDAPIEHLINSHMRTLQHLKPAFEDCSFSFYGIINPKYRSRFTNHLAVGSCLDCILPLFGQCVKYQVRIFDEQSCDVNYQFVPLLLQINVLKCSYSLELHIPSNQHLLSDPVYMF